VYVGGKDFSLRAHARNLNREELAGACFLARRWGRKLYVAVNIFARESDIQILPSYLEYLQEIGPDGLIVCDPGVLTLARRHAPKVPIHLSTQMNSTNSLSALFWVDQGVKRINVAREVTLGELRIIRDRCSAELEVFVHGAMCISYSGRCLLSAVLNERSANRGLCSQPCRWSYGLVEEKRAGEFFPVHEDDRGSYVFNSKDLCLLDELGKLMALGIDAFKIEGRMKGALYLAGAVRAYRQAIDRAWSHPDAFRVEESWVSDLNCVSHRPYTKGFLFSGADRLATEIDPSTAYLQTHTLAGIVRNPGGDRISDSTQTLTCVQVRSRLVSGSVLEFMNPDGSNGVHLLSDFYDLQGRRLSVAHPNSWMVLEVPFPTFPLQVIRTRVTGQKP
jgi:putative protease